jgi:hypothetical protein
MTLRKNIGSGLLGLATVFLVASCNGETTTYETSGENDAVLTAFSLSDNDSVCSSLSSYGFTIDQYGTSDVSLSEQWGGAGIIFNSDSLPLGSVPDSVVVSLSYSSPSSVLFFQYDAQGQVLDTVNFASQTYLDFSQCALTRMEITAEDLITKRSYIVKINIHTVEGDTIHWKYTAQSVWENNDLSDQHVEPLGENLYWYLQNGEGQYVAQQALEGDLTSWGEASALQTTSALNLRTMYTWNNRSYAISQEGGKLMTSTDATTWTEVSTTFFGTTADASSTTVEFVNLLGVSLKTRLMDETLFAIVRSADTYYFATTTEGQTWQLGEQLPDNFPVEGYTRPISVAARPSLGTVTSRFYIVGGKTADGTLISSTWTCDGTQWAEFKQPYLPAMSGASIARYTTDTDYPETFWILFSGETTSGTSNTLYFSENSGVTWRKLYMEYPEFTDNSAFTPVAYTSAFVTSDYRILLLGGRDADGAQRTDVATGQLIKLTFQKRR